jgi:hypothetical protein
MTPKEKAKELLFKFSLVNSCVRSAKNVPVELRLMQNKVFALIALEEILWILNEVSHDADIDSEVNFYNEVYQEIEKL